MMPTIVNGPELKTPLHNLISSARRGDTADDHWENGVTFTPRGCYEINGTCTVCDPDAPDKPAPQDCAPPPRFFPYTLDMGVSWAAPDRFNIEKLLTDDFEAGTSSKLEDLIWNGCPGVDNPVLADGESLGAAAPPVVALGRIVAEMISVTGHTGARGTIHMSPMVAMQAVEGLTVDGDLIRTKFGGHLVVVGNYPTDMIAGHIGEIDVYVGEPFITASPETIRRSNEQIFRIERLALAAWNTCAVFTHEVVYNGIDGGTP